LRTKNCCGSVCTALSAWLTKALSYCCFMAIWQFDFYLLPREAAERLHGSSPVVLGALRSSRAQDMDGDPNPHSYWNGRECYSYENAVAALLPARKSWAPEGLMFGDERSDSIELWDDSFFIRLDMRRFNAALARSIVGLAAADGLMLGMVETGHLLPASYPMLLRQIVQSRALKFARDPIGTLSV